MAGVGLYEVGTGKTYSTIMGALDQLYVDQGTAAFTATQEIRVYNGTYTETVTPNDLINPTATYRLIIQAATGQVPEIDAGSVRDNCFNIYDIDYVTIIGFYGYHTNASGIIFNSSNYGIAHNNHMHGCGTNGIRIDASTDCKIYDNLLESVANDGMLIQNGSISAIAYNNAIINLGHDGIQIISSNLGIFYSNTISNPDNNGFTNLSSTGITFKNNIVIAHGNSNIWTMKIDAGGTTDWVSDNNCYYFYDNAVMGAWNGSEVTFTQWKTNSGQDGNTINSNPLLVNIGGVSADDNKIASNSPCKDAGAALSGIYAIDYFGTSRPQGAAYDIGFHEYIVSVSGSMVNYVLLLLTEV